MNTDIKKLAYGVILPGFIGQDAPPWLIKMLKNGLSGVCLFANNIGNRDQLIALNNSIISANPDAVIAVDEEGGEVTRLYHEHGSPYISQALMGQINDLNLSYSMGAVVGDLLSSLGFTMSFAPDADVNTDPRNPVIGLRSFSDNVDIVANNSTAWLEGLQSKSIDASVKHFPGHGNTSSDSHLSLPVINSSLQELERCELVPFVKAIAADAKSIMTTHILLPQLDDAHPATMSYKIITGLLKEKLGYKGVIVTDALDMKGASGEVGIAEAAVLALNAGCDLLCIGTENTFEQLEQIAEHICNAVENNRLSLARLEEANSKVKSLAKNRVKNVSNIVWKPESTQSIIDLPLSKVQNCFITEENLRGIFADNNTINILQLESTPNIAVGVMPWGVASAHRYQQNNYANYDGISLNINNIVSQNVNTELLLEYSSIDLVVARGISLNPDHQRVIEALRENNKNMIIVECEWPSANKKEADIFTLGSSRSVSAALLDYLSNGKWSAFLGAVEWSK